MPQRTVSMRGLLTTALFVCLAGVITFVSGCGMFAKKEPDLPYIPLPSPSTLPPRSGGETLSVEGEAITVADMVSAAEAAVHPKTASLTFDQFSSIVKPRLTEMVNDRIAEIVIYHAAKKGLDTDVTDDRLEPYIDAEVSKFTAKYNGDYSAAEKELAANKMTWQSFRDHQKRRILTMIYVQKEAGDTKPVTHNDLVAYYDTIKDSLYATQGAIVFRIIDVQPDQLQLLDPNQDRLEAAKETAAYVVAMARGGEDFGSLAKTYSSDFSRNSGGLWEPVEPGSLAAPYDLIEQAITKMEPNDISDPIQAKGHIFIVRLEQKQSRAYKPFEEVQADVEKRMAGNRWSKTMDSVMRKRFDISKLGNVESFVDTCVSATYEDMRRSPQTSEIAK
jgi:parvulin-like peptidyl-prolyl isomerase